MRLLIAIFILSFSLTTFAYDNSDLKDLEKAHNACISKSTDRTYSKISCNMKVDYEKTNRKIKMGCDMWMEEQVSVPNSQSEMNDLRNLRENTALVAYDTFKEKEKSLKHNCQVSKALKNELKKRPSNIIKIYSNDGIY